ncbi:pilus (MSHA type) biogenesis protein MshL [Motiliproteus sp. MSK22-1]|uniref:pilus (MSHA type) biogenesis protein MshL n=1 Tax=Motiliproteus sp. MSK22-1 TaxID=1897630 RepID=UPI000976E18B|nr:pilus (MSHA type) biogenesis protein MshL [Motiliproteus sp. MSK22-1]OMH39528.1 pilus (MSHA type) biogenesis protein MshL [Motiliproteus sp. MSK22-1]
MHHSIPQMIFKTCMTVLIVMLTGCQPWQPVSEQSAQNTGTVAIEQALKSNQQQQLDQQSELSPEVVQALLPSLQVEAIASPAEDRFDVAVDRLDARAFFMGLVQGTPYNMVVSEEIAGTISLDLKDVTVDEVMQTVQQVYGYQYRRSGRLYQVVPEQLETVIFQIDYLHVVRDGSSDTLVSAGTVSEVGSTSNGSSNNSSNNSSNSGDNNSVRSVGTHISTTSKSDFWGQLQTSLMTIIGAGEGRRVVITPQAGVIVVSAFPQELAVVKDYLDRTELTLQRQVILEAKILEVSLSNGFQSGINWATIAEVGGGGKNIVFSQGSTQLSNNDGIDGVFGAAFNLKDFTALIELLETQGNVQVLSSPRVSTLNNQKAVIKVGTDEFFVTSVETTTTTGTATTTTPEVELTPFFSGIALDVTPQISAGGEIILHIHPSISQVSDQQKLITIGSQALDLPLALSTIRESDSVVRASSGQVIVIGGLMKANSSDTQGKTPGLGDIDIVGDLFRQQRQKSTKSELVILLKPTIANSDAWQKNLKRSLDNFNNLNPTGSALATDNP